MTGYVVSWNGGSTTVTGTSTTISGLTANTAYAISVKARDAAGNQSAAATLSVTTSGTGTYPAWALNATYALGDRVSYLGLNYECTLAHTAYSETWNPPAAPTLWKSIP